MTLFNQAFNVQYLFIQMEFCAGGSLREAIVAKNFTTNGLNPWVTVRGILRGVEYLHSKEQDCLHRDIKPVSTCNFIRVQENILLDAHKNPKLCDFGLATSARRSDPTYGQGTLEYMAPEIYLGISESTKATDIFRLIDVYCNSSNSAQGS